MKYTLHLKQNMPFSSCPPFVELEDDRIALNNVIFPWENNYHNCRLWVIGHEFGPIGAVWANCEQDALDELIDQNLGDCLLISTEDYEKMSPEERDDCTHLGNASEPCDLNMVWMGEVVFEKVRDFDLLMLMAEQRGACADNLYK